MPAADEVVRRLLDYFKERIDLAHVERVRVRHLAALDYEGLEVPPLVCYLPYEGQEFQPYPYPEAFADPAKMMVNELLIGFTSLYHAVELGDDAPLCLRPNLGTGIIASMFGAEIRLVENNMPWVMSLGSLSCLQAIVDAPLPDVRFGLGQRVIDQYDYYHHALSDYPRCQAAFELTLPDLQGPFDTVELLWGSEIFVALYTHTELVRALLSKITNLMLIVYGFLKGRIRDSLRPGYHYQHATGVKGNLLIRDDSAILMSPKMYREIVQPVDARLAAELEGAGIHFCGNGQHQVDNMLAIPGMQCLDLGQPEKMDLDAIYAKAAARRVPLVRLTVPEADLTARRVRERFPLGVSLIYQAESVAQARRLRQRYYSET
ncbi:MAG: hypothetical protein H8D78_19880 [Chloroflexi bacterium]|nr:hypothetical protein [Chloroflexota bacterium]